MQRKAGTVSALEMMRREIAATYTTPEERAAYRAGMSTAAAMCDEKAAAVRVDNPGRSKGSVSAVGEFASRVAKDCGDAIFSARNEIKNLAG